MTEATEKPDLTGIIKSILAADNPPPTATKTVKILVATKEGKELETKRDALERRMGQLVGAITHLRNNPDTAAPRKMNDPSRVAAAEKELVAVEAQIEETNELLEAFSVRVGLRPMNSRTLSELARKHSDMYELSTAVVAACIVSIQNSEGDPVEVSPEDFVEYLTSNDVPFGEFEKLRLAANELNEGVNFPT